AAEKAAAEGVSSDLFPASIIIGTMNYAVNGFSSGEKVEVYSAESGVQYFIKKDDGSLVSVPWYSVSVPSNPAVERTNATNEQIEAHINSLGITSTTNNLVWTDLYRQRTYVFEKRNGKWALIQNFLCSTGNNSTPTPRGLYQLQAYVYAFGMDKGYMCKYAVQIFGDYLFHSTLFDTTGTYELEGRGVLGNRASLGCIRFSEEDSYWFYSNLPLGTTVWIN
ncbi:MAG: hypothetical protein ATN34_01240, partial [Epulopiscium sp. Nele67-Bin002]